MAKVGSLIKALLYFYQIHSHNIHLKKARLVRRFLLRRRKVLKQVTLLLVQSLRRNIPLSKMNCFFVWSLALGLKKKCLLWLRQRTVERKVCPLLLLQNAGPLSPPWEPCTHSSFRAPDSLSAYLRIVLGTLCLRFCGKLVPLGLQGILPQGVL